MRPSDDDPGGSVFECYGCGHRERDPDTRGCPKCGSEMRNTGASRDL